MKANTIGELVQQTNNQSFGIISFY